MKNPLLFFVKEGKRRKGNGGKEENKFEKKPLGKDVIA